MEDENMNNYNDMVKRINEMPDDDLDKLIKKDECPFQPELMGKSPIGMFHCPACGEMIMAGMQHIRYGNFK